jgi:hypothetical protein
MTVRRNTNVTCVHKCDSVCLCSVGRAMAQAVNRRPLSTEARVESHSVHVGFVVNKVALGQVFPPVLRFSPVNFIPPVLHYLEK